MTLEPLRAALVAEADAGARRHLGEVEAECARLLAEADAQAHEIVRQGRLDGEAAAAKEAARRRAAATRRAREIRLRARQRQVEELERRAREDVLALRADGRYPELVERLAAAVHAQIGPEAEVETDPGGLGGVVGRRGRASVDYTLPALVERVVAGLDEEIEGLWR
jgi:vacuolar-type H+-ATPase subunit E/Vma4